MQLVLAIHADRRQTEHIAALLRKRAAAEVVQASDAGEGLQELGDRVPDLVLTSPLLSPFDEGVLAEYLRELGSAGAHIQTLRIPMLTAPEPSGSGFFSLRKKKKVEATPDGCDPAIFVEEITQYLTRAAEDRKSAAAAAPSPARSSQPAAEPPPRADVFERYSPPSPQADSCFSSAHHAAAAPDDVDNASAESAFPIYRPGTVAAERPAEPTSSSYRFDDVPSVEPPTYQVDAAGDVAPIYQPFDPAQDRHFDVIQSDPFEQAPLYDAPSFLDPPRTEPAAPLDRQTTESMPIYQAPAVADVYSPPPQPVVHVFEPPRQPAATTMAAPKTVDVTMDAGFAHAHASLVLDPSQPEAVVADPPFVVHSTDARIPLAESLERAAAELEASSLGEVMPSRETERVPMHQLSSIEEIPLPEELAARVERTAALRSNEISAPIAPPRAAPPVDLMARERDYSVAPPPGSLLASPIQIDLPPRPAPSSATPIGETAADPVDLAPEHAAAQRTAESAPEPEKLANPKRTASFEAALAAIRKAWRSPRRTANSSASSPLSLNLNAPIEKMTALPQVTTAPPVPPPAAIEPAQKGAADPITKLAIEDSSAREVDLTFDIEALDDHGSVTVIEPTVSEQVEVLTQAVDDDIYELSASPALRDLDSDLAAAGPPQPVREIFPASIVARVDAAAPTAEDVDPVSSRATRKDDKSRKRSDKRKPTLPTMPVPQAAAPQPPAPPTPAEPREPVQDEWGLFDPNRCGFAALVDKLNEVTDEKDQKPPTKTTVRVISYG